MKNRKDLLLDKLMQDSTSATLELLEDFLDADGCWNVSSIQGACKRINLPLEEFHILLVLLIRSSIMFGFKGPEFFKLKEKYPNGFKLEGLLPAESLALDSERAALNALAKGEEIYLEDGPWVFDVNRAALQELILKTKSNPIYGAVLISRHFIKKYIKPSMHFVIENPLRFFKILLCTFLVVIYMKGCSHFSREVRLACHHGNCKHGWYSKYNKTEKAHHAYWAFGFPVVCLCIYGFIRSRNDNAPYTTPTIEPQQSSTPPYGGIDEFEKHLETLGLPKEQINIEKAAYKKTYNL